MPPASVVIVSTYYPPVLGGAETAAAQLAAFLSARGHRVTVLTRRTARGVPDDEQREGVRVVRVAPRGPRTALGKWLAIPAIVMQLLKRRHDYDVVVCVDYRGVGLAALAARTFTGRPVIMQAATDGVLSFAAMRRMLARVGLGSLPHRDIELMAQIQVLDLKPAPRLEAIEDKRKDQAMQGNHSDGGCADSLSHCQAHADGIFEKDRPS